MGLNIAQVIREFLLNNKKEIEGLGQKEIADLILKENKVLSDLYKNRKETLIKRISDENVKLKKDNLTFSTKKQPKELKTPYKVIGNKHYFYPIKGEFSLPNELVDKLFYSFSKHGLDLSTTQIINKYNLEPWQWHAIKNALKLYKLSNIFSPHTVNSTDPEVMKSLVREKLDERINTLGYIVEDEYNKSVIKKYKEVIKQSTKKDLVVTSLVGELQDLLPEVRISSLKREGEVSARKEKEIVLVISDLHFGLSNDNDSNLPEYSTNIAKKHLENIVSQVNALEADKVHIFNLGDIIETFQGNNHVGSWKGIEQGYYGSRLVIECYQLFVNFILSIDNVASYNQLPGNHDRSSSSNKEDVEGFISKIVFEFLRKSFEFDIKKGNLEFNYNDILLSRKIGGINYIATHGHLGITKTPPSELILEYAEDPKAYTVLLQGHFHERRVKRDHKMFRDIIVPAIMPGNHYSVTSGYSSNPGFVVIAEGANKKPIVIDYSL